MTRARSLKHAIRSRAAKTGERYTTARRHVLNELRVQPIALVRPAAAPAPARSTPPAPTRGGGLSDTKAREKTGHGLDHWFEVLDRFGGPEKGHTALARHLFADHSIPGWHSQGITVAYERARGVRAVNQRCDGEYEVSITKVLHATVADVVTALSDARVRRRWTGSVAAPLVKALSTALTGPGSKRIVIRPDGQGRYRYKWGDTVVQMQFVPKGAGKLSLAVTNSKLVDGAMVEARRAEWRAALTALSHLFARA